MLDLTERTTLMDAVHRLKGDPDVRIQNLCKQALAEREADNWDGVRAKLKEARALKPEPLGDVLRKAPGAPPLPEVFRAMQDGKLRVGDAVARDFAMSVYPGVKITLLGEAEWSYTHQ